MKIIHTSDWHLGHTLYGYDRRSEQQAMLGQMERLAAEHRPDALLVCGDVFHTTQPSAAVQQMFVDALMHIHDAVPDMHIIVTAGNHDSATRHEVFRQPWQTLNVHTIGSVERGHEADCIVTVPGKGHVVAVPYINEHYLDEGFFQSLLDVVPDDGMPVVLMAHTTVSGGDFSGHDNATEFSAGGIDACPMSLFGEGYDYLALGHIHHAQTLHGGRARYCGTPLPVSFDETGQHSATLVEVESRGAMPTLTILPIDNPHPLLTLPENGYTSWEQALTLLHQVDDESTAYLRLNVEVDDFLPAGANAEAAGVVKNKQCRFCFINARRRVREASPASKGFTVSEFRRESPLSLVRRYAADKGMAFDDELAELFNSIL